MALESITQPVSAFVTGAINTGATAVKFSGRTLSIGYTNYLAPAVSLIAKGVFAAISNKTVQASAALGAAAFAVKKGYDAYKALTAKAAAAKTEFDAATEAHTNAAEDKKADAQAAVDAAKAKLVTTQAILRGVAPYALATVASVALAVFAVIR